jgi:probable phosphoglycerate mutase
MQYCINMKKLYVCRHGESVLNAQRIFAGRIDTPLTENGREQAKLAGQDAQQYEIDLIMTSPLKRTVETADLVADAMKYPKDKIIVNELFLERALGAMEGMSWDHVRGFDPYTGLESKEELKARAHEALQLIHKQPATNVLLVSHGSFLLAMLKLLNPKALSEELPNARIVEFI